MERARKRERRKEREGRGRGEGWVRKGSMERVRTSERKWDSGEGNGKKVGEHGVGKGGGREELGKEREHREGEEE